MKKKYQPMKKKRNEFQLQQNVKEGRKKILQKRNTNQNMMNIWKNIFQKIKRKRI